MDGLRVASYGFDRIDVIYKRNFIHVITVITERSNSQTRNPKPATRNYGFNYFTTDIFAEATIRMAYRILGSDIGDVHGY